MFVILGMLLTVAPFCGRRLIAAYCGWVEVILAPGAAEEADDFLTVFSHFLAYRRERSKMRSTTVSGAFTESNSGRMDTPLCFPGINSGINPSL
jgi:hypothetical protein